MKHRLELILLALVLGCFTTIAIAWGRAWSPPEWGTLDYSSIIAPTADGGSVVVIHESAAAAHLASRFVYPVSLAPDEARSPDAAPAWVRKALGWSQRTDESLSRAAFGWPWPALSYAERSPLKSRTVTIEGGLRTGSTSVLPVTVMWRGFLANSAIFAAPWMAVALIGIRLRSRTAARQAPVGAVPVA